MADKILPQRVRLHIFTFAALFFGCLCFYLLSAEQKNPGRFLMSGVLGRRTGPDNYLLFPNEGREDEGNSQEVLGGFRVLFCYLDGGWLI